MRLQWQSYIGVMSSRWDWSPRWSWIFAGLEPTNIICARRSWFASRYSRL